MLLLVLNLVINKAIIIKALYGRRTSGAQFHEKFADPVLLVKLFPCKEADPDVWMKDCRTHYEYVCVHIDDLTVLMKVQSDFFAALEEQKYKLIKRVGEILYHLGGDFFFMT